MCLDMLVLAEITYGVYDVLSGFAEVKGQDPPLRRHARYVSYSNVCTNRTKQWAEITQQLSCF